MTSKCTRIAYTSQSNSMFCSELFTHSRACIHMKLMTMAQWWVRITKASFMKIIKDPDLATSLTSRMAWKNSFIQDKRGGQRWTGRAWGKVCSRPLGFPLKSKLVQAWNHIFWKENLPNYTCGRPRKWKKGGHCSSWYSDIRHFGVCQTLAPWQSGFRGSHLKRTRKGPSKNNVTREGCRGK